MLIQRPKMKGTSKHDVMVRVERFDVFFFNNKTSNKKDTVIKNPPKN